MIEDCLLKELKGKKFKYNSPNGGLSEWTDEVVSMLLIHSICEGDNGPFSGVKYKLSIRGKINRHLYEFNKCVFIINKL